MNSDISNLSVAVIDYPAGNTRSVANALSRLGVNATITAEPRILQQADRVIFPGVGEARTAMEYFKIHSLDTLICSLKQPVLGICLGLQLFGTVTEERNTRALGIVPQAVSRFSATLKIPHMGWNTLDTVDDPLIEGMKGEFFYFVHSYRMDLGAHTVGTTTYGETFTSVVRSGNFVGVQFHPEKSSTAGALVLQRFLEGV